jgi:hypothetical protein
MDTKDRCKKRSELWKKFKESTFCKNKVFIFIFFLEVLILFLLSKIIFPELFPKLFVKFNIIYKFENELIELLRNGFSLLKDKRVLFGVKLLNTFWLYCSNITAIFIFQMIIYWWKIRKINISDKESITLQEEYFNFFGSKSYIANGIENPPIENSHLNNYIVTERKERESRLKERIFKNKKKFTRGCFWLLLTFMLTYITLLVLSAYKISEDSKIDKVLYGAKPLNTTVIEYNYLSEFTKDEKRIRLQIHPSLLYYIEDGVVYNLEDFAIITDTLVNDRKEIPWIRKGIGFKHSFLKSNKNIFIRELDTKKMEFDKIEFRCLENQDSLQKMSDFKMINLYEKYINKSAKIENCIKTLLANISTLFALILFARLSYDTQSFKRRTFQMWEFSIAIFFFAILTIAETCLAILLYNNSYIVGNFICRSMSALVSVIVIAALAGRLIFLLEDTNNNAYNNNSFLKQLLLLLCFLLIYIYAVSQIFYPFEVPIIKSIGGFSFMDGLFLLSLSGKIVLFIILCIFIRNERIEKFFIFEIDLIKSPTKNKGLEDFKYLMKFEYKEKNDMLHN